MANTTPAPADIYRTNSKQLLVTRDPVYNHPSIQQGRYIGRKPHDYFPFAVVVTIINPVIGPLALLFSYLSNKSFKEGDVNYAVKWSNYAFLSGMITIVASCVIYIAVAFAVGGPELRGGHSY